MAVTAAALLVGQLGALDVPSAAGGLSSAQAIIAVDANATHPVSPFYLGCHSDSGFVHQPRGLYAQMYAVGVRMLWVASVSTSKHSSSAEFSQTQPAVFLAAALQNVSC